MPKEQSSIRERQRTDLREPRRYKVTIYNDDFTTMEFVVQVLTQVFFKSESEAEALMLQVRQSVVVRLAGIVQLPHELFHPLCLVVHIDYWFSLFGLQR